jgi:Domain of unknown function (DUF397)
MEHMSAWRKSTYSGGASGNCTEIATVTGAVLIRDSKNPDGLRLAFGRDAWARFAEKIKQGLALPTRTPPVALTGGVPFPGQSATE